MGLLWLGPDPRAPDATWVYEVEIEDEYRGKGLGRATMIAAEGVARALGHTRIGLNVFAGNLPAATLYTTLGYETASMQMRKSL